jgi:hypothetical protein
VGFSRTAADTATHAFLWTKLKGIKDLATRGGNFSTASALNDLGRVVGYFGQVIRGFVNLGQARYFGARHVTWFVHRTQLAQRTFASGAILVLARAFLWTRAKGMQDLNNLIASNSGWLLIFAKSYERDFGDALALTTVATTVAVEIRVQMTDQERASLEPARPVNPKALEDFLEGRYHGTQTFISTLRKALDSKSAADEHGKAVSLLGRAIQEDPNFAPANVELANTNSRALASPQPISRNYVLTSPWAYVLSLCRSTRCLMLPIIDVYYKNPLVPQL